MDIDDEVMGMQAAEEEMPYSTSPNDPLTYDPTQGAGTPAWQDAVRKQMEHNAKQRRN